MNYKRYPWLKQDNLLNCTEARTALDDARRTYLEKGAVTLPQFVTCEALQTMVDQTTAIADTAFTTHSTHTAYLKDVDYESFPKDSVYNHLMPTHVASIAFDEIVVSDQKNSPLADLYQNPKLLQLVSYVVTGKFDQLYLSVDPLGCCSINVFRPGYHHSFHFDESTFSTTLMLQPAADVSSGLFQYTPPLRNVGSGSGENPDQDDDNLALDKVAATLLAYDNETPLTSTTLVEGRKSRSTPPPPPLHTLDFQAGTLSIFAGSRSLHRVTRVQGTQSRLVAVLTYSTQPGFCNSGKFSNGFYSRVGFFLVLHFIVYLPR
jgi:hypothetical protein